MNLNCNPTLEQLRDLLGLSDDAAGHHILWVDKDGNVNLTTIARDQSAAQFDRSHPDMHVRFEPFLAGNEYVGPEAAEDRAWLSELLERLVSEWARVKEKRDVGYVGSF